MVKSLRSNWPEENCCTYSTSWKPQKIHCSFRNEIFSYVVIKTYKYIL